MNLLETVLNIVANLASESTSCIGFYEPKMPQQLMKPEKEKKKEMNKCSDILQKISHSF